MCSDFVSWAGDPKHDRSRSPYYSKENSIKTSDNRWKRKKDLDRDSDHYRERKSYRNSYDHHRHDDYGRHRRRADDEERSYLRSSQSLQESRSSGRSEHTRQDAEHATSKENWRNGERYSWDRLRHINKDKERETAVMERHEHNNHDLSSDRSSFGKRRANSNIDEVKMEERESHRNRGVQDETIRGVQEISKMIIHPNMRNLRTCQGLDCR